MFLTTPTLWRYQWIFLIITDQCRQVNEVVILRIFNVHHALEQKENVVSFTKMTVDGLSELFIAIHLKKVNLTVFTLFDGASTPFK